MSKPRQRSYVRLLAWTALVAPNFSVQAADAGRARVEMECRIPVDPASEPFDRLLIEVQTPTGSPISRTFARGGEVRSFKRLFPGIFVVCLTNAGGGRRCQSVDLYPPPGQLVAKFSVTLGPPPAVRLSHGRLFVVPKEDLRIPKKARREFNRARNAQSRGETAEARQYLERSLEICPDYPEALINLGSSCYFAGEHDRAIGYFRRATEIAPERFEGWLNLGVAQLAQGEPREALRSELRALSLRPDDPLVIYQVGLCLCLVGQFDQAKEHLKRVAQLDPCSATFPLLLLAQIALIEKQPEQAARLIRESSRLHPYNPHAQGIKQMEDGIALQKGLTHRLGLISLPPLPAR